MQLSHLGVRLEGLVVTLTVLELTNPLVTLTETTSKHACLRGQATKLKQLLESKQASLCQTENDKQLA